MFASRSLRRFAATNATRRVPLSARQFQISSRLAANKESQDKDSMKIESNEYSKSGSDQKAAQDGDAFDGSKTKPESEGGDPALDVSPQNHDVSKPKKGNDQESGSPKQSGQGPTDRSNTSGGGSPKKSG